MRFQPGSIPHNKGVQTQSVLNKLERFRNNLPILCKTHGYHLNWRVHSRNNVKCNICAIEYQRIARKKDKLKFKLQDARQHSRTKNMVFDIDRSLILEMIELQSNKCALSGVEFVDENYSIDRINSSIGYTKDNIQLVLFEVNRMKSDLDMNLFLDLCNKISKYKK